MVVEQEVGNLARHPFVAVLLHLVGLGPVRTTIAYTPHSFSDFPSTVANTCKCIYISYASKSGSSEFPALRVRFEP